MKKYSTFLIAFIILSISTACEDDALLDPQVDSSSDGGSYGNISIPGDDSKPDKEINPEIF
jgi:hypothetical protein